MNQDLINLLFVILGVGGIGTVIVNGLFGRDKAKSDSFEKIVKSLADTSQALMELAETRIINLSNRAERLESRIDTLENEIKNLRSSLTDRETTIATLQQENHDLQCQVDKLVKENKTKDKRITELSNQIKELTTRLNALTNGDRDDYPGTFC